MDFKLNDSILFNDVSDADCEKMYRCLGSVSESFKQGDIVFEYTSQPEKIGIVSSGNIDLERIDMFGGRFVLDSMGRGDVFGEMMAFANPMGDAMRWTAKSECKVIFILKDKITHPCENACDCHSLMIKNLLLMISNKARRLSERLEVISNKTIREKLMYFFMLEAEKQGSNTILLPFSSSALADYICADRSAMMRELASMKRDGIVNSERRKITILK